MNGVAATTHPVVKVAESTTIHRSAESRNPLVRGIDLWHLVSLDAPTVAMLWTWFLARTNHISLPATAILAMGTAVWMLYAADRLLDSRAIEFRTSSKAVIVTLSNAKGKNPRLLFEAPASASIDLEPRHYFHRNHQRAFRCGILFASISLALLLPQLAPQSIRLYLVLGTLLFGYFILIHVNSAAIQHNSHRLPKELAVGVFFSAATFIPTVASDPSLRLALLPAAILFAVLCSLNCLFIYHWEHPATSSETNPATNIALRLLPLISAIALVSGLILAVFDHSLPRPIPAACSLATILLLLLHRNRHHLSPTTLRAAADICLLTPFLFLYF